MADLLKASGAEDVVTGAIDLTVALNLYCWRCNDVHTLTPEQVERLIYALTAEAADNRRRYPGELLSCLLEVLRWASDSEAYLEHVEQGQECRYWHGSGRSHPPQHLVDAYDGGPIPEPARPALFAQAISETGQRIADGAALDAERHQRTVIICETDSDACTCGAPVATPAGMHHNDCPTNPASPTDWTE